MSFDEDDDTFEDDTFGIDEEEPEERPEEITMKINDDGVMEIKKEPYATVDIPTEKDWADLQNILSLKRHIPDCNQCMLGGCGNCDYYTKMFASIGDSE
jgi:hypothetical protein